MKKGRLISRGAFTLVELLIGASLSAAIMAAVLSSYIYMGRSLARLANQQTLETEARRTLGYFAQDVQSANGIAGTPSASNLTLSVPTGTGAINVAYAYDSSTGILTGTPSNGATQVLLRNITDNDSSTSSNLFFRYYDASGNPYDNGTSPYTTVATYSAGIKQLTLQFSAQVGNSSNGTQTLVTPVATGRLLLRNKTLLP